MEHSARFAIPFLAPGQMQKELYHNEALARIDMLLCPVVEGPPAQTPPATPAIGSTYLAAAGATGAWAGYDGALTCFTDGGWKFAPPIEGTAVLDRISGEMLLRRNGAWEAGIARVNEVRVNDQTVLRNRQPAITDPAGGDVNDVECRSAVASILGALRAHGLIE